MVEPIHAGGIPVAEEIPKVDNESEPRMPNGFTKLIRRVLSVLCAIAFFGLIAIDYVAGLAAREIPIWLYALLFSGAAAGWGPVFNILSILTNTRSK